MADISSFEFGLVGYLPPGNIGNVNQMLENFCKFKTKHPVVWFGYGRTTPPGMVQLKIDPEYLKSDPQVGAKNRLALQNATFFTGLKIARENKFTHMMYLEPDCRFGCDFWDEVLWQEFLARDPEAVMAGSPVVFNPSAWSREAAWEFEHFLKATHPRFDPIPTAGSGRLAEKQHTAVFPNGALAIYSVEWLWKVFGAKIEQRQIIPLAIESRAWDYEIGLRLWNEFDKEAYKKVTCLTKAYSGYGELMTTEEERKQWLNSGKVVAIHQIKSNWVGPDKPNPGDIVPAPVPVEAEPVMSQNGSYPPVEILIVSFRRDADFLRYNLMSIRKFAVGFTGTTVVVPTNDRELFEPMCREFGATLKTVDEPKGKGMLNQMCVKFNAEQYCDAEYILHSDSDCIFSRRVTPLDYFKDGRPVLLCRPYSVVPRIEPGHEQWQKVAEAALGFEVTHDSMVRAPLVHHRSVYPAVRAHVEKHVGKPFRDWMMAGKNSYPQSIAEFPTIGAYALKFMPEKYAVTDIGDQREPPNALLQGWSVNGPDHVISFKDGVRSSQRARFEEILSA